MAERTRERTLALPDDADAVEDLARTLSQSVNARVLAELMRRRRREADRGQRTLGASGTGGAAGASEAAGEGGAAGRAGGAADGADGAADGTDDEPQRPDGPGWMYLSEIADAVGEAPGTVGSSLQKLLPLLEEERVKGRRFFRSRVLRLTIRVEEVE